MNSITLTVGILICAYALWVLTMRLQGKDSKFRKLEPMRQFWGPRLGSAIHYLGYVIAPFALGIGVMIAGLKGVNLLTLLQK
jgi:hypothetical protein